MLPFKQLLISILIEWIIPFRSHSPPHCNQGLRGTRFFTWQPTMRRTESVWFWPYWEDWNWLSPKYCNSERRNGQGMQTKTSSDWYRTHTMVAIMWYNFQNREIGRIVLQITCANSVQGNVFWTDWCCSSDLRQFSFYTHVLDGPWRKRFKFLVIQGNLSLKRKATPRQNKRIPVWRSNVVHDAKTRKGASSESPRKIASTAVGMFYFRCGKILTFQDVAEVRQ